MEVHILNAFHALHANAVANTHIVLHVHSKHRKASAFVANKTLMLVKIVLLASVIVEEYILIVINVQIIYNVIAKMKIIQIVYNV